MAFDAGAIVARMDLRLEGWKKSINEVKKDKESLRGLILRNEQDLQRLGVTLGVAGASTLYLVKSIAQVGINAIESENKFEVSFGRMASSVRRWSDTMSRELGVSSYAVRDMSSTLNAMLMSMRLGEEQAADMSMRVTELAYDMASFYNMDVQTAFEKIRSGLMGQVEPLQQVGVLVYEDTIKQYAWANGIARTGRELTQQEKVLARYGSILEQTAQAQGDLARTADSPANQLRRLESQIEELKTELSMGFLPVLKEVLEDTNDVTKGVVAWAKANPDLAAGILTVAGALGVLEVALAPILLAAPTLAKLPWGALTRIAGYAALTQIAGSGPGGDSIKSLLERNADIRRWIEDTRALTDYGVGTASGARLTEQIGTMQEALEKAAGFEEILAAAESDATGDLRNSISADLMTVRYLRGMLEGEIERLNGLRARTRSGGGGSTSEWAPLPEDLGPMPWMPTSEDMLDAWFREADQFQQVLRAGYPGQVGGFAFNRNQRDPRKQRGYDPKEAAREDGKEYAEAFVAAAAPTIGELMDDVTWMWQGDIRSFFDAWLVEGESFADAFERLMSDMLNSVLDQYLSLISQMLAQDLFRATFGAKGVGNIGVPLFGGGTSGGEKSIKSRATGGRVARPELAIIGDDPMGPERVLTAAENRAYEAGMGGTEIRIVNESGTPVRAREAGSRYEGKRLIRDIVLEAALTDTEFRDVIRGI